MTKSLVVDIGGTYSRFALINQYFQMECKQSYLNYKFKSFIDIFQNYLSTYQQEFKSCSQCCIAVAGPVKNGNAQLTNINWHLNKEDLQQQLAFERIELINDFHSLGFSIPLLKKNNLLQIQAGQPTDNAMKVILGAGTGLGIALVKQQKYQIEVYPSEGGHVDFAPTNERQIELLQFLFKKYQHVSVEHLLSGHGIEHIFEFISSQKKPDQFNIEDYTSSDISGQKIIQLAMEQQDETAIEAIKLFSEIYATYIGNVALQALPYGGIYITGGIARHILPYLRDKNFLHAYKNKGRMSSLLTDIPIYYILNQNASLLGSGYYLRSENKDLQTAQV